MVRNTLATLATILVAALALMAPSALAKAANPLADVSEVSCTLPGDCSSAASYNDAVDLGQGVFNTETNGTWGPAVPAKFPANASVNPMPRYEFDIYPKEFLNVGPFDFGSDPTGMEAVQCSTPGNCAAVGNYQTQHSGIHGVFFTEKNGHWARGVEALAPAGSPVKGGRAEAPVTSLACTSAGDCTAIGNYLSDQKKVYASLADAYTETNGVWSVGEPLALPEGLVTGRFSETSLVSISCPTAGGCVAAGSFLNENGRQHSTALIATETAGAWTLEVATMPSNLIGAGQTDDDGFNFEPGARLTSVSCPVVGGCTIAGTYTDNRFEQQPVVVDQTPGGWSQGAELTLPAGAAVDADGEESLLSGLECQSADNCSAVGSFTDTNQNQQGLLFTESAGVWTTGIAAALPTNATAAVSHQTAELDNVSCVNAGNCVAVGQYNSDDAQHTEMGMVSDETAGVWSAATDIALPANVTSTAKNEAEAVDCVSGTTGPYVNGAACTLTGGYSTVGGFRGLAANGAGGVWQQGVELKIPGLTRSEVVYSIRSVNRVGLFEGLKSFKKFNGYRYYFHAAERGKLKIEWFTSVNGHTIVAARLDKSVAGPGYQRVKLTLTPAGRKAILGSKTTKLTTKIMFHGANGASASGSSRFTLHVLPKYDKGIITTNKLPIRGIVFRALPLRHA